MLTLIKNPSQIVTVDTKGKNYKRGKELKNLSVVCDHSILIEDSIIKDFIPNSKVSSKSFDRIIDASDSVVLPGLVECHTHAAFAGNRANEFMMRLQGATYGDIAKTGGGIISTVKSVRDSSFDELIRLIKPRIANFISQGVTTLEIKSGYGLSFYDEIKILQVINHFRTHSPIEIIPTFLGAHTYPPEYKNDHKGYLKLITQELLPYVKKNKLAEYTDVFCESTAFSTEDTDQIFTKAKELGFKLRLHTDQFNSIGGIDIALKHKVLAVDHLEVANPESIAKLASSKITSVLLPGVSFFLGYNFAPVRELINSNAIVALSTDFNPGSSNILNLHLIMSLAALKMKMTSEEIISAVTINAAKALDLNSYVGSLEIGKQADFAIFDVKEYPEIIYNIGNNLNKMTIKKGEIVYQSNSDKQ